MMKKLSLLFVLLFCILTLGLPGCGDDDDGGNVVVVSTADNKVIFVTSVEGNGDLGTWADAGGATGLAAGDNICQARAQAAGLSGTFVAWLSDDNDEAYCRIHGYAGDMSNLCGQASLPAFTGPWVRTDGFPFSETIDQLVIQRVYAPARYDEFSNLVSPDTYYWTGTNSSGDRRSNSLCSNWTSSVASETGHCGGTAGTSYQWSSAGDMDCDIMYRLLCMQTGAGPALPPFTSTGKKVFVTSVAGDGDLGGWADAGGVTGLAAGDNICQARALAAGLANALDFKAWLSTSATDAIDRLISDGPWVRLDGVKIADNKTDLTDGTLFTAISLNESGNPVSDSVWTGTEDTGLKSVNTCNNWIDGTNGVNGISGISSRASTSWTQWNNRSCDYISFRLYCFED